MRILGVEIKLNIPNALSILRLLLLPVFALFYLNSDKHPHYLYFAIAVLVISGATDILDGIIARKFNMITDFGKLLDPLADKITQLVVVICLATTNRRIVPLLVICVVKEICQALGGVLLLKRGAKIDGAKWYGKVSTAAFYSVMAIFMVWADIPQVLMIVLIGIVCALMLFSFFRYIYMFFSIKRELPENK